ncbi:MAG: hypothetical protein GYA46_11295, partial [candidate division Zixibacteria bacterium]|nr:hypothetical protein [candidate division Zixibacteria bacterium]
AFEGGDESRERAAEARGEVIIAAPTIIIMAVKRFIEAFPLRRVALQILPL